MQVRLWRAARKDDPAYKAAQAAAQRRYREKVKDDPVASERLRKQRRAAARRYQASPAGKAAQREAQRRYLEKVAADPVAAERLREQRRAAARRYQERKAFEAMLC